jgi:hypothetical protein
MERRGSFARLGEDRLTTDELASHYDHGDDIDLSRCR